MSGGERPESMVRTLILPADLRARLRAAAEAAYPRECCGLLVGREVADARIAVRRVIESPNVADPRRADRFEVDPRVRLAVMRETEGGPDRLIGHYHSHPDGPAKPSPTDQEMAFEPDLIWLIIAVAGGRAGDVRGWRLNGTAALPVAVCSGRAGSFAADRFAGQIGGD